MALTRDALEWRPTEQSMRPVTPALFPLFRKSNECLKKDRSKTNQTKTQHTPQNKPQAFEFDSPTLQIPNRG